MAGTVTIKIEGLDQLAKTLEQDLPEKLAKRVIKDAMQAGADVFASAIATSAPVRSGELSEDITTHVYVRNDSGRLHASAIVGPGYDLSMARIRKKTGKADRTTVPGIYALFVERGHVGPGQHREAQAAKRRGVQIEFGSGSTPPHPFMTQAFDGAKQSALDAIVASLHEGIEAAAKEVAKK